MNLTLQSRIEQFSQVLVSTQITNEQQQICEVEVQIKQLHNPLILHHISANK